jgi:hypothetical protein
VTPQRLALRTCMIRSSTGPLACQLACQAKPKTEPPTARKCLEGDVKLWPHFPFRGSAPFSIGGLMMREGLGRISQAAEGKHEELCYEARLADLPTLIPGEGLALLAWVQTKAQ